MLTIRLAQRSDLTSITDIYNDAVRTTTATFDTEPKTEAQQLQWFESHGPRHPILVAELDGAIVGWASLTKWSDRRAYDETAETSFYVQTETRGQRHRPGDSKKRSSRKARGWATIPHSSPASPKGSDASIPSQREIAAFSVLAC